MTKGILFVSLERFNNSRIIQAIRGICIALFSVEEAHCISKRGHSFRADYLHLSCCVNLFNIHPQLAVIATATPIAACDNGMAVMIPFPAAWMGLLNVRPTIRATVFPAWPHDSSLEAALTTPVDVLVWCLRDRPPGPTIIYVILQVTATQVSDMLRQHGLFQAQSFHAGMRITG